MNFTRRPLPKTEPCVAVNLVAIPHLPGSAANQTANSTLVTYHRPAGGEFALASMEPDGYRAVANGLARERAEGLYRYGQWRYLPLAACKLKP